MLADLDAERANPLLSTDPPLRIRYFAVRGAVNMRVHPEEARADWEEVLAAAKLVRSEAWEGRAKGEMSICAFLAGDYAQAKALSDEALAIASSTGDVASEVRQRSLKGVALLQQRRYDEAEMLIDRAIKLAEDTPNIRFPIMAYLGKSEILTIRGTPKSGAELITRLQKYLQTASAAVYLADLYLELAQRASRRGNAFEAAALYERAAAAAQNVSMPRPYSSAQFNLARLKHTAGDHNAARVHINEALKASEQLVDSYVLPHQLALAA